MNYKILIFISLLFSTLAFPQQFTVKGKIIDSKTGEPLLFANVRVGNDGKGAASNKEGFYELKMSAGRYSLSVSYVGYNSLTKEITVNSDLNDFNFELELSAVNLPEITVTPGENPALAIIREAIKTKNRRDDFLKTYTFRSYTKATAKTPNDISVTPGQRGAGIGLSAGGDTSELKISAIVENISEGFFSAPSDYKEIIIARKQTANLPPFINVFTGGRFIQNFYEDVINVFGQRMTGPIANDALSYYYYYIKDTVSIDGKNVFKIHLEPEDLSLPGLTGELYILDKSFDLIRAELSINKSGIINNFIDSLLILQQFFPYGNPAVYMPVDFNVYGKFNYLGIARAEFDINTSLNDYKINPLIPEGTFSKAIVTVLPDADEKDSLFWSEQQVIVNSDSEVEAYRRIDSIQSMPRSFWDDFSLLGNSTRLSDELSISGPLSLWHFNRIEGNTLNFNARIRSALKDRLNSSLDFSYGFADEKFKYNYSFRYLAGDYRTHSISFSAGNSLEVLFRDYNFSKLFNSFNVLISKYEHLNYYYSKGFNFEYQGEIFPVIRISAGFQNRVDNSAIVNTNFSFFNKDKIYTPNPEITEGRYNIFSVGIRFDPRDYVEDGVYRRRIWGTSPITFLDVKVSHASPDFLNSTSEFTLYESNLRIFTRTSATTTLNIRATAFYNEGNLPFQLFYPVPGNMDLLAQNLTFRTLDLNEVVADRALNLFVEHNFADLPFRLLGIDFLKKLGLVVTGFVNMAITEISVNSAQNLPTTFQEFKSPFYEAGFGILHPIIPIRLDFGFKLNYRGKNNFRIGINSFITL